MYTYFEKSFCHPGMSSVFRNLLLVNYLMTWKVSVASTFSSHQSLDQEQYVHTETWLNFIEIHTHIVLRVKFKFQNTCVLQNVAAEQQTTLISYRTTPTPAPLPVLCYHGTSFLGIWTSTPGSPMIHHANQGKTTPASTAHVLTATSTSVTWAATTLAWIWTGYMPL